MTEEEHSHKKLPEESFYYSKQRNFILIATLCATLITTVYMFVITYHTMLDRYYGPIYTFLTNAKNQYFTSDSIYLVPIVIASLFLASIAIFVIIRIIYYGKQLLDTRPQLEFTHEGLRTPDERFFQWKDITKLEITSSTTYSTLLHDYVIQKCLHIYFFTAPKITYPISEFAQSKRIEELVHLYNEHHKKVAYKKTTTTHNYVTQIILGVVLIAVIILTALYIVQPLLLESFSSM